jgi:hypothetical protein
MELHHQKEVAIMINQKEEMPNHYKNTSPEPEGEHGYQSVTWRH